MEHTLDELQLFEPLVLAQGPFNRYVVLHLAEPQPTYTFVIPAPMTITEKPAFPQFAKPVRTLRIIYRLLRPLGDRGPYIYEYDSWQVAD